MDRDFRIPLGVSDERASTAERLQFTQGEGPCRDAALHGRAIAATEHQLLHRWPVYAREYLARTRSPQ